MNNSSSVNNNIIIENPNFEVNRRGVVPDSASGNNLSGASVVYSTDKMIKDAETLLKEQWFQKLENKYIPQEKEFDPEADTTALNKDVDHITDTLKSRIYGTDLKPLNPLITGENQSRVLSPAMLKAPPILGLDGRPVDAKPEPIIAPDPNESLSSRAIADMQETINNEMLKEITINSKKTLDANTMAKEYLKCRMSALYFIENYVSVPVAGGRISMKESEQWNATNKYKIIIELFQQYDSVLYMSSRQSGKTTTSAMYLLWCMVFFPNIQISYLTLDKNRAIDMISRMKVMMDSLPKWLQVRPKSNAERMSYYELSNGSKITASFVSGSNDPDKVGRGLSSPIVFIDETAFIPHARIVWGALQPSVSAAKQFAKKNGYPNGVIFTSTPNGAGDNFFYNVYQNSVKFDDIYDYETKGLYADYQKEFSKPGKNSFISVVLHWSEFRSQEWYEEQKKELNFDQKKINQELDLSFLGSNLCIFSDEVIQRLVPKKRTHHIKLPFSNEMDFFDEIDPNEKYILGVDTAMSAGANSDYSACVLTRASDGKPIGEWKGRFSVVKRFAQLVKSIIKSLKVLYGLNSTTLIVVIERNSIGKETVEELIYDDSEFDYEIYLFGERTSTGEVIPGLYTSNSGRMGQGKRDQMFNMLMAEVNEKPHAIHGRQLIDELRNLEQKSNGRIEASKNQHDDIVMAWNFCLYARKVLIELGELFIKGESRIDKALVESSLLNSVLSTGNIQLSDSSSAYETEMYFTNPTSEQIHKLVGVTQVKLGGANGKAIRKADIPKPQAQKPLLVQENLREIMKNVFVQTSGDPDSSDYEEYDPSDYFHI